MKRHILSVKGIVFLLALFLGAGTASAYDFSAVCSSGQRLYYSVVNSNYHYVQVQCPNGNTSTPWQGYEKPSGNLVLPSTVSYGGTTFTVTGIGLAAFSGCDALTSLTIPSSVTSIGNQAFVGCTGLTGSLTIPNSVTTIDISAFNGCSGFTGTLTIPSSVTSIGTYAFKDCSGFSYVNYNATNSADVTSSDKPFEGCGGQLQIGTGVQRIPAYLFSYASFTSLTISTTVTSIGQSAFKSCSNLTQVNYNAINCADASYSDCPFEGSGGNLVFGNQVQRIPAYMFCGCPNFTGPLTIPNSVTSIGYSAFNSCTGFTGSLTIGNSVTSIDDKAFYYCSGFTGSLSIPNSVTTIGSETFYHCSGFTGSLTIGNSVTSIGTYAFYFCDGFTGSLTIGNSVTSIGNNAFSYCNGFTGSLTIPNSVTTLGYGAFKNCIGFTGTLSIGNSVTSIGSDAFSFCTGFTSMKVRPETPPTISSSTFGAVSATIPVYVPCTSLADYQAATVWKNFQNMQCLDHAVTLSAIPADGGTLTGEGIYEIGTTRTVTATPNNEYPYYQFLHWSLNGEVVSCNATYSFTMPTEDIHLEAVFMRTNEVIVVGGNTSVSPYLPSHSFYNYSLTQQIYTAEELGTSRTITTISFFNAGATKTRTYDIYMKQTTKTCFSSTSDWVSVTSSDKVYSGSVTMRKGLWTTIVLDTPFFYSNTSNLVLVADDNSGNWSNNNMTCRTYAASGNQTLRIYGDGTDYSPSSPSSYTGTLMSIKNQIILNRPAFNINATASDLSAGTVSGAGQYGFGDMCRLKATPNSGYIFMDWTDNTGTVISTDEAYSFIVENNKTLIANFIPDGDYCSITFDLKDSYGDGWGNNYLTLNLENGMTRKLTVPSLGTHSIYSLPIENGSYVDLSWHHAVYAYECSFEASYANGNVLCMSKLFNMEEDFEYRFYINCDEMPASWVYIGDHGTNDDVTLPSHSYYKYSMSEQIYTADEIGRAGSINSIAFYNQTTESRTRTYDIYLKPTSKTAFNSSSDAISVSDDDKVFSGEVVMASDQWTFITFDRPFEYDGLSNVVLVVDDNTGDYSGPPYMACRVFNTTNSQAFRTYSDNLDYDAAHPSYYSLTFLYVKNQVYFVFAQTPTTVTQTTELAEGWNWFSYYLEMDPVDAILMLEESLGENGVQIKNSESNTTYEDDEWFGDLDDEGIAVEQMYKILVVDDCIVTLEGTVTNPANHPIDIVEGWNWIGFPVSEVTAVEDALADFDAEEGDMLKNSDEFTLYEDGEWFGDIEEMVPGMGYMYLSNSPGIKSLIFQSAKK